MPVSYINTIHKEFIRFIRQIHVAIVLPTSQLFPIFAAFPKRKFSYCKILKINKIK
jgi:hypothetical protein